jgi:hypothetical protein
MKLLTTSNTKIKKGEKLGFMSFGIHLAPAKLSGFNVCKDASKGCAAACLNTAGMGVYSTVQAARIAKTKLFFSDKQAFMTQLFKEINSAIRKAEKSGMIPCFRLNLTSDLPWEKILLNGQSVFQAFPNVQFYDYTKTASRMTAFLSSKHSPLSWGGAMLKQANGGNDWPSNYHLTFSRSESNGVIADSILKSGGNVAMVFRKSLPKKYLGARVIDGDETDLRFKDGKGKVIGLKEKGLAKKDLTGFVLEPNEVEG